MVVVVAVVEVEVAATQGGCRYGRRFILIRCMLLACMCAFAASAQSKVKYKNSS